MPASTSHKSLRRFLSDCWGAEGQSVWGAETTKNNLASKISCPCPVQSTITSDTVECVLQSGTDSSCYPLGSRESDIRCTQPLIEGREIHQDISTQAGSVFVKDWVVLMPGFDPPLSTAGHPQFTWARATTLYSEEALPSERLRATTARLALKNTAKLSGRNILTQPLLCKLFLKKKFSWAD